jgi:hypothetical protein
MKKFVAMLHDSDEQHLLKMFQSVVECLRENGTRKVVPLLTRVVLFEFEDDRAAAYTLLAKCLGPADQIAVFEIVGGYSGSALRDQAERLDAFFRA